MERERGEADLSLEKERIEERKIAWPPPPSLHDKKRTRGRRERGRKKGKEDARGEEGGVKSGQSFISSSRCERVTGRGGGGAGGAAPAFRCAA